jgi:dTDP-glucose 4,6-dehydratase
MRDLPIPVYGSGKNVREWIYVVDHCAAVLSVLKKGVAGEVYNVSSGSELSNIELVKKILVQLGKPDKLITFVEDRPGHDIRYCLDSSKIQAALGWKPKFSFTKALTSTVKWYVNNEEWWRPLATEQVLSPTPWKPRGHS